MSGSLQRPIKLLHIAETIRGGIASYLNELHPQQQASFGAENIHYVVPSDHRGDLAIDDAQMTTFERSGRSVSGLFHMLRASLQAIDSFRPDVVHLHSSFAGLVLRPALAARPQAPSVIYCPHGWAFSRETGRLSHQVSKAAERLLTRTTDRIICISADEFNEAVRAGIPADRLTLVPNGISMKRPEPSPVAAIWPSKKAKVLFIGRLDRQKGFDLLIEAARLLEDVVDVRIVGASVVNKFDGPAVPPNVTLLGWLDRREIETHLEAADLVVIPSRWEAFGLVALEAMRAAKPILAFRIGALPEIVVDGVTGVLCEPVTAAELVQGFRRALDLDLNVLGHRGYERFKQYYDVQKTHRQLRQVYMEVLQSDERRPEEQVQLRQDVSSNA
ncbi:glycosyltransferase [Bradyrhizobium guangzhouense]|uniref:glycosyltransferase n=1 Tax=Bradyrhizobium guangzhouense TaxID=1325095 RepID=UPI001FE03C4B|nr:glycosyltransferase [Bradyrhizobium guangzhouense]